MTITWSWDAETKDAVKQNRPLKMHKMRNYVLYKYELIHAPYLYAGLVTQIEGMCQQYS